MKTDGAAIATQSVIYRAIEWIIAQTQKDILPGPQPISSFHTHSQTQSVK